MRLKFRFGLFDSSLLTFAGAAILERGAISQGYAAGEALGANSSLEWV
jgi:hypothetical protein